MANYKVPIITGTSLTTGDLLRWDGSDWVNHPDSNYAGGNHDILDGSVHSDSIADGVTRGSIIFGNSTPKWDELILSGADTFLGSTGTDLGYRTAAQVMASLSTKATAAFDLNGQDLTNGGVLFLTEQAAAEAHVAGKGQFWVKTAAPNEPWFDNDTGTEIPLDNRYVDRGNLAGPDFHETGSKAVLNTDGAHHDLDLSGIIPVGTVRVKVRVFMIDNLANQYFLLKDPDHANDFTNQGFFTQAVNTSIFGTFDVGTDSDRNIDYQAANTAFTTIDVSILGWWLN